MRAAFARCLKELEFFPTIGKIREVAELHEAVHENYVDPKQPVCRLCNGTTFRYTAVGTVTKCKCPQEEQVVPEYETGTTKL